jgi:hypothetical protein
MADQKNRPTNTAAEESILAAMKKDGWDAASLEVVRLWWEYEALDQERRVVLRQAFGMKMFIANRFRFDFPNNCPIPEPLEQIRISMLEVAAFGKPHMFFPRDSSGKSTSEARAYSHDVRQKILALAAAAVVRLHTNHRAVKKQVIEHVAKLLDENSFTSASGKISSGGAASLTKHVASAEHGKASFQEHYDFAMRFEPLLDPDGVDLGAYQLLEVLVNLCKDWRLL